MPELRGDRPGQRLHQLRDRRVAAGGDGRGGGHTATAAVLASTLVQRCEPHGTHAVGLVAGADPTCDAWFVTGVRATATAR